MKNTTYYFPHDYNARKDPKCIALIKDFGMTGYGLYWCLVEVLYEQGGRIEKFPALYEALAHEFGIKVSLLTKQIEAMLHKYNLLRDDENYIWSESVLNRLQVREEKKEKRVKAGREGGIKSGESRRSAHTDQSTVKQNEALVEANEANEPKKRKVKESKVKDIDRGANAPTHTQEQINGFSDVQNWINQKAPRVAKMKEPLTIDQYLKLKERFPKDMIGSLLMKMHNWGDLTKRQSAYLTFLSFAEKDEKFKAA